MITISALSRVDAQMMSSSACANAEFQYAVGFVDRDDDVSLSLTEGRHVAQGRPVGGEEFHNSSRTKALQALTQAQDRQRAVQPAGVDNKEWLVLRHGLRKLL